MLMDSAIAAAVIFGLIYLFIIRGRPSPVITVLIGAALIVILGVITSEDALRHIDLNVILLLASMMVIADIMGRTGAFDWLAYQGVKLAKGNGFAIMTLLLIVTAVVSAFIDNVTTVVLIFPITLVLCRTLNLSPIPFLLGEIFASNIGGAATVVGDPPNIIAASVGDIDFLTFMINIAPVSIVGMVFLIAVMWFWFRKKVHVDVATRKEVLESIPENLIKDPEMLWRSLIVFALTIAGFLLHHLLDVEVAFIAIAGAGVMMLVTRVDPRDVLDHVEWPTLGFFVGLFILVGGLVETGVIMDVQEFMVDISGGNESILAYILIWGGGAASGVVDNIPYTAAMAEVVKGLTFPRENGIINPLWWALVLGADLGGNITMVGASANVVVVSLARNAGYPISFFTFFKYGIVVAIGTLLIAMGYIWLLHYL
ncbi:MAG: ArsB/NhaD family transporter [Chloroflexi bacterium]|nr:ArsB/NhaD family transporter [Chloroflexota bacterium]